MVHDLLHKWDRTFLQRSNRKLCTARREFERVVAAPLSDANVVKQTELAQEIEFLLEQEEIKWAQRSRLNWLQHGDKNTSYFHNFASARHKKNMTKKLKDGSGAWKEGNLVLNPMISQYFAGLFSTEIDEPDPVVLDKVVQKITEGMNEDLLKPYSPDEVKKALFSIGDMKAPGLDGLHAIFFKKVLEYLGRGVDN